MLFYPRSPAVGLLPAATLTTSPSQGVTDGLAASTVLGSMPSYYSNAPRAHTPDPLKTGKGEASIFRGNDCMQKVLAGEEHPLVNTSHNKRGQNLQHTHPYTFAALRQTESNKAMEEHRRTLKPEDAALLLNPPVASLRTQ